MNSLRDWYYSPKWRVAVKSAFSHLLFYVSFSWIKNGRKLQELKGSLCGRRAFIICNGPSLRMEDLETLARNSEISIASNRIDEIFDKTSWRPTYYTVLDEWAQYKFIDKMQKMPSEWQFLRIGSFYKTYKVKRQKVFLHTDGRESLIENPRFSADISKIIYTIGTVTYAMMEILVFLGVREIYIIGCDNHYPKEVARDGKTVLDNKQKWFSSKESNNTGGGSKVWIMDIAYAYAHEYADAHGIKIFNATRGGHLEEFPRVDFDSLFENK